MQSTRGTEDTFDYVIVGAGSAGCVLAARLSEEPSVRVCLLEAGAPDRSLLIRVPLGLALLVPHAIHNWAFKTAPQPGLGGRRGYQPRGKTLGAAARSTRWCTRADIAATTTPGRSSATRLVVRRCAAVFPAGGTQRAPRRRVPWSRRSAQRGRSALAQRLRGALARRSGRRRASAQCRLQRREQEGIGLYQLTQKNGERWSAARALSRAQSPPAEPRREDASARDGHRVRGAAGGRRGTIGKAGPCGPSALGAK
jgi:choline dehydrogenase-like flavoprotein